MEEEEEEEENKEEEDDEEVKEDTHRQNGMVQEEKRLFERPAILLEMIGPPAMFGLDDLNSINLPEPEEGSEFTKEEKMILIHAMMGKLSARNINTVFNKRWDWIPTCAKRIGPGILIKKNCERSTTT